MHDQNQYLLHNYSKKMHSKSIDFFRKNQYRAIKYIFWFFTVKLESFLKNQQCYNIFMEQIRSFFNSKKSREIKCNALRSGMRNRTRNRTRNHLTHQFLAVIEPGIGITSKNFNRIGIEPGITSQKFVLQFPLFVAKTRYAYILK